MANYYLGTVLEVLDPDLYKIKIDLPGLSKEAEAFPMRGELDEPRPGDQVLVRDIDPIYHSFYLYSELKDDNFIGFRSRGKMVQITEDELNISIFDPEEAYEENDGEIPSEIKAYVKIKKNGNIEISNVDSDSGGVAIDLKGKIAITAQNNSTIEISGDSEINVSGNSNIRVDGDSEIKVGGDSEIGVEGSATIKGSSVTIDSSNVTITGGMLTTKGSVAPQGTGPFCAIPICPLTGAPHVGPKVMGT